MPFPLAAVLSLISTGLPGLSKGKLLELQVCLLVPVTERLDWHGDEDDASVPTDLPIFGYFLVIFLINATFALYFLMAMYNSR